MAEPEGTPGQLRKMIALAEQLGFLDEVEHWTRVLAEIEGQPEHRTRELTMSTQTEYTPKTAEVREMFSRDVQTGQHEPEHGAGFDRWLEQMKTEAVSAERDRCVRVVRSVMRLVSNSVYQDGVDGPATAIIVRIQDGTEFEPTPHRWPAPATDGGEHA